MTTRRIGGLRVESKDDWDDDDHSEDYEDYPDTARDCIGWEEDMIKNGSPF